MPAARKWVANDFYEGQMTLATLRLKAGLTQAELAKKVDMPQSSVARLESGRENPSLTRAKKIADVLAVSLEDRKSTRLNSSHVAISYAVFCLKKKNTKSIY